MTTQVVAPPFSEMELAAGTFRILSDPNRLHIVWVLAHGEHSVNEIAEHIGAQPPSVSQHLAKLRLNGLVGTRRDGNRIYYRLVSEHVRRLVSEAALHGEHLVDSHPRHHRAKKAKTA